MLKILHTGDIHLDSPFAKLDARRAEIRRAELRDTFSHLITYACENGIDLILIAGDLFDREFVTRESIAFLQKEFARFENPIVVAPGNHDCFSLESIWTKNLFPENVHVFSEATLQCFSFASFDVYGYAFTSPEIHTCPLTGHTVQDVNRINLLCVHGELGVPLSPYCPISRGDLAAFGADYAALGHIHNPPEAEKRDGTVFAYCGCLEGRAPDEIGPKGAVLVEIEKDDRAVDVRTQRLRFSRRRYETENIDCTGADTMTEIEGRIRTVIEKRHFGDDVLLRAVLGGAVSPSFVPDPHLLETRFPQLFSLEILDETVPAISAHEYENDRTVRGEFYRILAEKIENGSPEERRIAAMALRFGLSAVAGENIIEG